MLGDNILKKTGFRTVSENYYTKKTEDIDIILKESKTELNIIVPCASARIDDEHELDVFLKEHSQGTGCLHASFNKRSIRLTYSMDNEEQVIINRIDTALELIKKADDKFDLLPVCSKCGRVISVEILSENGNVLTICDVCKGEIALQRKQSEIIEEYKEHSQSQMKFGFIQKKPVADTIKAGFQAGLIASAIGLIFFILSNFIPIFYALTWIPGAAAGYFTSKKVSKIEYMSGFTRGMIGSLSAITTITILSFINVYLVLGIGELIYIGKIMLPSIITVFQMGIVTNIGIGLGGFLFMTAVIFAFKTDI